MEGTSHPKELPFFPFHSFTQHVSISPYHVPSPTLRASLEEDQLIFSVGTLHIVPLFLSTETVMHI